MPAHNLPEVLRVQTKINGEEKQNGTTDDLIFSIPQLIMTLSDCQTLQPGDVLATGTPAGVGIGRKPPVYLKPGDQIEVSVTKLVVLRNKIAGAQSKNYTVARVQKVSHIPTNNLSKSCGGTGLTMINSKPLYYRQAGESTSHKGTSEFYVPLISASSVAKTHKLHLFDIEGHGLSPTLATSVISIDSYAEDVAGVFAYANITSGGIVVAHSMSGRVALVFALKYPQLVSKLVLLGPPPSPLPETPSNAMKGRAAAVRQGGMAAWRQSWTQLLRLDHLQQLSPIR